MVAKRFNRRKTQTKNQKLCIKMQSIIAFLDITKVADFREKMLMSAKIKACVM